MTDKPTLIKVTTLIGYGSPNKVRGLGRWRQAAAASVVHSGTCVPGRRRRRRVRVRVMARGRHCARASSRASSGRSPRPPCVRSTLAACRAVCAQADTHDVHGAPLGPEETKATRENLKWSYGEFEIPGEAKEAMDMTSRGAAFEGEWNKAVEAYKAKYPAEYAEFSQLVR